MSAHLVYKEWVLKEAHDSRHHAYGVWEHPLGLVVDDFLVQEGRFGLKALDWELEEYLELHPDARSE
jgi:hypothetical protein